MHDALCMHIVYDYRPSNAGVNKIDKQNEKQTERIGGEKINHAMTQPSVGDLSRRQGTIFSLHDDFGTSSLH